MIQSKFLTYIRPRHSSAGVHEHTDHAHAVERPEDLVREVRVVVARRVFRPNDPRTPPAEKIGEERAEVLVIDQVLVDLFQAIKSNKKSSSNDQIIYSTIVSFHLCHAKGRAEAHIEKGLGT